MDSYNERTGNMGNTAKWGCVNSAWNRHDWDSPFFSLFFALKNIFNKFSGSCCCFSASCFCESRIPPLQYNSNIVAVVGLDALLCGGEADFYSIYAAFIGLSLLCPINMADTTFTLLYPL